VHEWTGATLAERTSAGTTGLLELGSVRWSAELLAAARIPLDVARFPPLRPAGTVAGVVDGVPVTLVHGHDTASAIAGLPRPTRPRAFVSSGTWLIVGAETARPVVTEAAFRAGLTNEAGPAGGNLLARNLPGFVIVERLLTAWGGQDLVALTAEAAAHPWRGDPPSIDALAGSENDADLIALLSRAARRRAPGRAELLQVAFTALARATAEALRSLAEVTGIRFDELAVVGGGVRTRLFLDLLEQETGLPVMAGSAESAALGNALVQARAHGLVAS
jgi:rhamnulokinase